MKDSSDARHDIHRLQRAIEAISRDLDAVERRPHFLLRRTAETMHLQSGSEIESFVGHFAFAVSRGRALK